MVIHRSASCPFLFITIMAFVMLLFALIVIVAGKALYAQAISNATNASTITPHVTIAFVGNTSPMAGIDNVSVAGVATDSAASSENTEQKIVTLYWGDGTSSHSKITRIPSSSDEAKWGPLYHKYDSATAVSNPYAIIATMDIPPSSFSNREFVQIRSEPYLINVQKSPIKVSSPDSARSTNDIISKNDVILFKPISHLANIIALMVIGSVTACSIYTARHMRNDQNMTSPIDVHRDEK